MPPAKTKARSARRSEVYTMGLPSSSAVFGPGVFILSYFLGFLSFFFLFFPFSFFLKPCICLTAQQCIYTSTAPLGVRGGSTGTGCPDIYDTTLIPFLFLFSLCIPANIVNESVLIPLNSSGREKRCSGRHRKETRTNFVSCISPGDLLVKLITPQRSLLFLHPSL